MSFGVSSLPRSVIHCLCTLLLSEEPKEAASFEGCAPEVPEHPFRIEEPSRERPPRLAGVVFGVVLLPVIRAVVEGAAVQVAGLTESASEPMLHSGMVPAPARKYTEPVTLGRRTVNAPGEEAYLSPAAAGGFDVPRRWPAFELV